ncbi:carboxymuconolactone decarboxylase family protein [Microbacterium sp. X-17]|uniref:carboxymuconolactone decarboxylase family protein n=1 Tax=Microbacterium sp. X-17 TaxID=3144404 RepID=UPI0031F5A954
MSGPRVSPVTPGTVPSLADLEATIRRERGGEIPLLYEILLNSPAVAGGWERMLTAVRNQTVVEARLRELIILRVAVVNDAPYEFAAHVPHGRAAGLSEGQIDAVSDWTTRPELFTDEERLLLTLTDQMTRGVTVDPAVMNAVGARYTDQEVVEVVAIVAAYNMVSRLLVALAITH